jgi:hypothetical protein
VQDGGEEVQKVEVHEAAQVEVEEQVQEVTTEVEEQV